MKDNFEWNDALVAEYGEYYRKAQETPDFWGQDILAAFKKLKTVKNPLFTTEDGVEIYDGMIWWEVGDDFILDECNNWTQCCGVKYFSTKEKALQYIAYNKKSISHKDLKEFIDGYMKCAGGTHHFKLAKEILTHFQPKESATK